MRNLVTGATGLIGRHLVWELLKRDESVRILARETSETSIFDGQNIGIVRGDILDLDSLEQATDGIEAVYHCAAKVGDWGPKKSFLKTNIEGTKNILSICVELPIKRLIYVSSIDIFATTIEKLISEKSEITTDLSHPYVYSKVMAEKLLWEYYTKYNIPVTVIYPPWVYGPGDNKFLPVILNLLKKRLMFYADKGNNHIELCYAKNVAQAIIYLANKKESIGEGYIVSDKENVTFKQLVWKIADIANLKRPKIGMPYSLIYAMAFLLEIIHKTLFIKERPFITRYALEFLGNNFCYDSSKIKQLGFYPQISFEEALTESIYDLL